jgi:hypothetical protein
MMSQVELLARAEHESHLVFRGELVEVLGVLLRAEAAVAVPDPWTASGEGRRDRILVGRWVQNILHQLCRVDVLVGDVTQSQSRLGMALDRWKGQHRANGWESGFRPLLVSLRGHVELLGASAESDVRKALGYFVRAIVMFRGRSQQPEWTADILRGVGAGLQLLKHDDAALFFRVADEYRDVGSCGLWAG